jgi:hypothetical protein
MVLITLARSSCTSAPIQRPFTLERAVGTTKYTKDTKQQRLIATKVFTGRVSGVILASHSSFVCLVYFVV